MEKLPVEIWMEIFSYIIPNETTIWDAFIHHKKDKDAVVDLLTDGTDMADIIPLLSVSAKIELPAEVLFSGNTFCFSALEGMHLFVKRVVGSSLWPTWGKYLGDVRFVVAEVLGFRHEGAIVAFGQLAKFPALKRVRIDMVNFSWVGK